MVVSLVLSQASVQSSRAEDLEPGTGEASLGLDAVGYLHSSDQASEGFRSPLTPKVVGKWSGRSEGPLIELGARVDLTLIFSPASSGAGALKPVPYLEAPEAYIGTSRELAPVQLHLGRRLERWSHLDEAWQLGIWQPRFRWDYLHPETVGLTGAFLSLETDYARVVAWGSPVFIPERGVPIGTRDGQFASDSRWFVPPPSRLSILGRDTPVRYGLELPELADLVENPGASIMARLGARQGPWVSAGYAYKPINQLLLATDGTLQGSERDPFVLDAQVYARVAYQHLSSLEAGYETDALSGWVSLLAENPVVDGLPSRWTSQSLSDSLALSANLAFDLPGTERVPTRLDLGYLRQWGGNADDRRAQDLGPGSGSIFEARYPYSSAASFGVTSQVLSRLTASSKVVHDFRHEGTLWSIELRYRPRAAWVFGVGADLLSAPSASDPDGTNLIGRFRANDRVHAGVSYVF